MSFGINGPDNNMPAIQKSHHTNDGGAGNLGYFQRERKKKEEKEEQDVFEFSEKENKEEESGSETLSLDSIGSRIKSFWMKVNKNSEQEKSEDN